MIKFTTYKINGFLFFIAVGALFFGCSTHKVIEMNYVDYYDIAPNLTYNNSKVGGISGIDFNVKNNSYFLISDDRSEHSEARFYEVLIDIKKNKIDSVVFLKKTIILDENKNPYAKNQIDLESIRFSPNQNILLISDEGGEQGKTTIRTINNEGEFIREFPLSNEYLSKIRKNKSFESLSFSKDYQTIFYATEAPILDDGMISTSNNRGVIRIFESNFKNGKIKKELKYWLEKVPQKAEIQPPWNGTGSDNGLSEILSLNSNEFLTLERSGAYQKDGSFKYICKVFFTKITKKGVENIFHTDKKELIDFSKFSFGGVNVEGMTLGPIINQKQSVLFVSDNNFKNKISTRIFLFTMYHK